MAFHLEIVSFLNALSRLHKSPRSAEAFLRVRSARPGARLHAIALKGISPGDSPPRADAPVLTRQVPFIRAKVGGSKSEKNKQVEAFVRGVIYTSIIPLS